MAEEGEKFDAIVVGAGPAGSSAAYVMAKAGMEVVLLERGDYPGAKNVWGGVLFRDATEAVFPEFWEDAPLERPVVDQRLWMLGKDSVTTAGFKTEQWSRPPYNAFTAMRAKIDPYFAKKAEDAGAFLIAETQVTECIFDRGTVVGVRTGREEGDLFADVVLMAEGVNCWAAVKSGLRRDYTMENSALAVKEIISLPEGTINDRFNVPSDQGATILCIGEFGHGTMGSGFIYTNKDTLSVGFGAIVEHLSEAKVQPNDLLEEMKSHPAVSRLLAGGETKEYSAHLIPEMKFENLPRPYGAGYMLLGDSAGLVNFMFQEGANLAIMSGKFAGETAVAAKKTGDFSADSLALYQRKLAQSFVVKDLRSLRKMPGFFRGHRQFFTSYPRMVNEMALDLLTVDGMPKLSKGKDLMRIARRERGLWGMARDAWDGARSLR
ncbi:MAG TPA: FAD-dependent oxidoreductase [Chloroflexota bacterium]|jgi:electron transfer flavoprotein-quinone oxidoreductase|nr:FAD-dependent oxidoreductase [Chloroflexota bacterium]